MTSPIMYPNGEHTSQTTRRIFISIKHNHIFKTLILEFKSVRRVH